MFLLILTTFSCSSPDTEEITGRPLIPKPQQVQYHKGIFVFGGNTTIFAEAEFELAKDFLQNYFEVNVGWSPQDDSRGHATIVIEKGNELPAEGYEMEISGDKIQIRASDPSGAFYAMQTLRQLLPDDLDSATKSDLLFFKIPSLTIKDAPAFRYRGMHLDVGRHFFDKEFIKEYISYLSMLKMNYFHWHLTEDQGWRIEILQYPNLTKHGAYREETLVGHYNDTPQQFDNKRYGGYYTQEDIKEVVAFAQAHNVTIIPEIEMPGHAQAAISAYPELGCTGEQVPVATKWGVFENIYCPKEETFTFLKNVLSEVMELFPGEYIHIGGDEAPKAHWKNCNHCQQLIADLGLKDEHELQSYFIKEIESFVNSKGKKIIGWDEILEGGLAPNATVMSWRGTEGAVQAAKEGHDVILTPTSHAYFDYYQAEHSDEPLAIGGFLPLKKVYGFNPIPEELTESEAKFVLGAQGNVWTEYMPTEEQVEYMAFPRMLAMSEVVWSGPTKAVEKDFPDFLSRVEAYLPRMDRFDINYANHLYDVSGKVIRRNDSVFYTLTTEMPNKEIQYSLNSDTTSTPYVGPIPIKESTKIKASVLQKEAIHGRVHSAYIHYHKGIESSITLNVPPHAAYSAGGKEALINGVSGSDSRYGDKEWLGFWGDDVEITFDFGAPTEIKKVSTRYYNAPGQWIYAPEMFEISASHENTKFYASSITKSSFFDTLLEESAEFEPYTTQFLTIRIPNYGVIPEGLQGAGNKAWTFIDEIIIE
ncbi:MAG: family 20 glycosylhydrolase [Aureisphaera sp.]